MRKEGPLFFKGPPWFVCFKVKRDRYTNKEKKFGEIVLTKVTSNKCQTMPSESWLYHATMPKESYHLAFAYPFHNVVYLMTHF